MNKIIIPTTMYIELTANLADYILLYSSTELIYTEDSNGDTVYTEAKQAEFNNLNDVIDSILFDRGLTHEWYTEILIEKNT